MANKHKDIDKDELLEMAYRYCDFCIASTKEIATNSGVKQVRERHIPTVSYFLLHWLRREQFEFYKRTNWYDAMKDETHPLSNTIKGIDELFNSLARDIVANEGKGIFYAKNKLGMHDRQQLETRNVERFDFDVND
jgi:hypothetical protein